MIKIDYIINKKLKLSLWILLISVLVFTINHTFYPLYQSINKNNLSKKVEKQWNELKSFVNDTAIIKLIINNDWSSLQQELENINNIKAGVWIYDADSLIYWSTNDFIINNLTAQQWVAESERGIFLCYSQEFENYKLILSWQLQESYPIKNNYLTNKINKKIDPLAAFELKINNKNNNVLENLEFIPRDIQPTKTQNFIALLSFILFLFGLYLLISALINKWKASNKIFVLLILILTIIGLLWILTNFLSTKYYVFNPSFFALSLIFNNIGKTFLLVWLAALIIKIAIKLLPNDYKRLFCFVTSIFFSGNIFIWLSRIFNATEFPYSYYEWISTKVDIIFVIILAISLLVIWTWSIRLMLTHKPPKKIVYSGFAFYTIFLIFLLKNQNFYLIISMLGILLWLIMYLLSSMNKKSFRRYFIYIFSGMIVAISSFLFMRVHHQSFSNYLLLNAVKISSERDLILENHLNELQTEISADRFLVNYANSFDTSMQWLTHIKNHYLSSFQDQYDIIGFICSSHDKFLNNNLEINCWQYYDSIVEYSQAQHISDNLYFITNANITYYLYKIMLHSELPHQLYLELYKKKPFRPEGYLELLVNIEEEQLLPGQLDYATYYNNTLMQSYGNTIFPLQVDNEIDAAPIGKLFKYHDKYAIKSEIDNNRFIVLVSNHTLPNWLSIFSFFIIIILLLYLIYYILIKGINIKKIFRSYAGRLQITLISIITIVILVAGILSVKYIQNTYSRQLEKQCFERNYGLYLSLQDEIVKNNIKINSTSIDSLLWKYKYSYFSDLHFYNTDGTLLSTTQFALFNDHLLTTLINPDVYWTNKWKKYWYYSNKEKISEFEYRNTYMPVFRGNNIIGILSIPMFSQITELRGELSELIGAFINIYAILLLISLIFTFLITQYINRPLQLISKRLKSLNLSKQNEKIEYKSNDEIGQLVKQYNQMIDELAEKAEKLAQNEREIAWREMAKQVAHEIKNPLTPMKLSVQFLQRIWKQDKKRFEQDIEKYLTTLLEQIEQLSEIATAFSQFNKMPEPLSKEVNLITLLQNLAALFHSTDYDINIHLESDKLTVIGDESRLNRAFTNILQNAVQALSNERRGEINIYAKSDNNNAIIIISDNGIGIANEMLENIFEPNFTTKSSGTGLGLAIVKHIIEDLNGKILVESLLGEGTKFTIILPLCY